MQQPRTTHTRNYNNHDHRHDPLGLEPSPQSRCPSVRLLRLLLLFPVVLYACGCLCLRDYNDDDDGLLSSVSSSSLIIIPAVSVSAWTITTTTTTTMHHRHRHCQHHHRTTRSNNVLFRTILLRPSSISLYPHSSTSRLLRTTTATSAAAVTAETSGGVDHVLRVEPPQAAANETLALNHHEPNENHNNDHNNINNDDKNSASMPNEKDNDDFVEYYYDALTEQDFVMSEWLVGTNWSRDPARIVETWVRLAVENHTTSGAAVAAVFNSNNNNNNAPRQIAVWGDGSFGRWSFDVASQFLSISKESNFPLKLGKCIWACTTNTEESNYYYLQGTVRGWNVVQPASVLGQWQAKRLGVNLDEEDPGIAPWFETDTNDTKQET